MANERGDQGHDDRAQSDQGVSGQGTATNQGQSGMQGQRTSPSSADTRRGGSDKSQKQGQDQGQYRKDQGGSTASDPYGQSQTGATSPQGGQTGQSPSSGDPGMGQGGSGTQERTKTSDIQNEPR